MFYVKVKLSIAELHDKINGLAAIRTRVCGFEARQDILATPRVHMTTGFIV